MAFLLLVTTDTHGSEIRELLAAQGWWVSLVGDRESAMRVAADQEPDVVIVDSLMLGARELVKVFSSRNGGPGSIVLGAPEDQADNLALVEVGADELLSRRPRVEELTRALERVSATPRQGGGSEPLLAGRRLTAAEIFGDIVEEVEGGSGRLVEAGVASGESADAPWRPEETSFAGGWQDALLSEEEDDAETSDRDGAEIRFSDTGRDDGPGVGPFVEDGQEATEEPEVADVAGGEAGEERPHVSTGAGLGSDAEAGPAETSAVEETRGSADSEPSDVESTALGQYELQERIAVGGMAEVWRASMVGLEGFRKTVAIKKILPHLAENEEFVRMFVDEAKLAAQLSHENLVDIYDLGRLDEDFFIAMEFVDGKDLRSILNRLRRQGGSFPLDLALYIAGKTAAALDYAHSRRDGEGRALNLVHRDVSPRNILISHRGNVRLCDFGVAKAVSSVPRTEIGALKGKIQYMSPEQAAGSSVDSRSDIFSLGGVLFEMITGRRPFVGDNEISLLEAVRRGDVDDPRQLRQGLPEDVAVLLEKALEKSPEERFQTAGEMEQRVDDVLFGLGEQPSPTALSTWLADIFEAEQPLQTTSGEPLAAGVATDSKAPPAVTTVTEPPRADASRLRFWLGIVAGLALAALTALMLEFFFGRA